MKNPEVRVTVKNRIEDLLRVNSVFESFATQHEIGGRLRYHLLVSIEEILTNIIKYGFDEEGFIRSTSPFVIVMARLKWNSRIGVVNSTHWK